MDQTLAHPDAKPGARFAVIMVVVHAVLWSALVVCIVAFVPRYQRMFRDFDMQLPAVTEMVLSVSDWFVNYWYMLPLVAPVALAIDAAAIFLLRMRRGTKVLGNLWAALWIVLPVLVSVIGVVALWLPWAALDDFQLSR